MKQHTYERFQGIWWGGIMGMQIEPKNFSAQPDWLLKRRQIAKILLETERLETDDPALQLRIQQIINLERVDNLTDRGEFPIAKNSNKVTPARQELNNKLLLNNCNLLSLLPLIIFLSDNHQLFSQIIHKYNLKSVNSFDNAEMKQDILIWSYLITFGLSHQFSAQPTNLALAIERILNNLDIPETLLVKKLTLVVEAVNNGTGLHQLVNKISSSGNIQQTAIALACYCFITTPNDFKLSITRTLYLQPQITWLTAALTGTLSGAYNGLTGIPWNWRSSFCHNPDLSSENQLIEQLFKKWLGIYSIHSNEDFYNQKLCAVAIPQIIQPRINLKIISQKFRL